jgi:hypothetical protein
MIVQLSLPGTPPSLNTVGSRGAAMAFHRHKKQWEGMCMIALLEMKVPKGLASVEASAVLRFKDRRRRDEGNYRAMLEKALGDALVLGGHLIDDTPDRYRFAQVNFDEERGNPLTTVTLDMAL